MRRHDAYVRLIHSTVVVFAIGFPWTSLALGDEPTTPATAVEEEKATPADSGEVQERAVPQMVRLQNYWKPYQYVNMESGPVVASVIQASWGSAMWILEPVEGFYRIRNSYKSDQYLNNQNGPLQASAVSPGWHSAMWTLRLDTTVVAAPIVPKGPALTAPTSGTVAPPGGTVGTSSVVLYEHPNFGGRSQPLGVGQHRLTDFNEIVSSIKVPQGLVAVLYEHADAGGGYGSYVDLLEDRPDLSQVNFNDKLSYVRVFSSACPPTFIWVRNKVQNGQFVPGHWERQPASGTPVNTTAVLAPPLPPHPPGVQPAAFASCPTVRDGGAPGGVVVSPTASIWDLVPFHNGADDNGFLLNPQWGLQTSTSFPPPTSLPNLRGDPRCQRPVLGSDPPSTYNDPFSPPCCSQSLIYDSTTFCKTVAGGHYNYKPATYEGMIFFKERVEQWLDGDINWGLLPIDKGTGKPFGGGLTSANDRLDPTTGQFYMGDQRVLKLEFNGAETINHFATPWWKAWVEALDASERADGARNAALESAHGMQTPYVTQLTQEATKKRKLLTDMTDRKHAIVTGLFGADCAHDCRTELHPVWAMAIRVKADPSDEVWAIFVRRSGDEGFCSSMQHVLGLPNNTYTFRMPWMPNALSGEVKQATFLTQLGQAAGPMVTFSPNQGVLVSFTLPSKNEMLNGELHLRWVGVGLGGQPPAVGTRSTVETRAVPGPMEEDDEPESALRQMIEKMPPAQKATFMAKIPPETISKDGAALKAAGPPRKVPSLPARVLRSHPQEVSSAASVRKQAKNQQLLDALHAVYGPTLPIPPPKRGPSR